MNSLPTPLFTQTSPGMSDHPPPPTGLKTETPPESNAPENAGFVYQPEKKEPTLEETHPIAASLLHGVMMTIFGKIAFIAGAIYLVVRAKGGSSDGWFIALLILGGISGVSCLYKLCKRED